MDIQVTKSILNQKKVAFQCENKNDRKSVQERLRKEIKESKKLYKEKVEFQYQLPISNMADAWKGLKTLTGQMKAKCSASLFSPDQQK